jgi:hypothetical protein
MRTYSKESDVLEMHIRNSPEMINTISDCFPSSEPIVFAFFIPNNITNEYSGIIMLHVAAKQVLYFLFLL